MKHKISSENPFEMKDSKKEALEDAYKLFISILSDYSEENNLPPEFFFELNEIIKEAYQDKKLNYFLESRFDLINGRVNKMVDFALNNKNKVGYTNLFYLNHTNQLVTNE
jgi:hypothetical protein